MRNLIIGVVIGLALFGIGLSIFRNSQSSAQQQRIVEATRSAMQRAVVPYGPTSPTAKAYALYELGYMDSLTSSDHSQEAAILALQSNLGGVRSLYDEGQQDYQRGDIELPSEVARDYHWQQKRSNN